MNTVLNTCQKMRQSGFSIIELMIGVIILAILMGIAMPSFNTWIRNTQIRNAAESIQTGLQRARAEAVTRNTNVDFVLGAGSSWTVKVSGGADIETRSSHEGSENVTVAALASDNVTAATSITFNNLGGVVPTANSLAQVNFNATGGNRPLRIVIGVGGNARMCDPSLPPYSSARAC